MSYINTHKPIPNLLLATTLTKGRDSFLAAEYLEAEVYVIAAQDALLPCSGLWNLWLM